MMPINKLTGKIHVWGNFKLGCICGVHYDDLDHDRWARSMLDPSMQKYVDDLRRSGLSTQADEMQAIINEEKKEKEKENANQKAF